MAGAAIQDALAGRVAGTLAVRSSEGYESIRTWRMYVKNVPDRYPAAILVAKNVEDVQAAVKSARACGVTVSVRSGGGNWVGASLRDDALLIDVGDFDSMEIDAEAKMAKIGPAVTSGALAKALDAKDLCFPTGHCPAASIGGFIIGGGYGVGIDKFGMACKSIVSMEIVDAAGELRHVDEQTNAEFLWMARGAYTAAPFVVVSLTLRLYPHPPLKQLRHIHAAENCGTVLAWADAIKKDSASPAWMAEVALIVTATPPPMAEAIKASHVAMFMAWFPADTAEENDAAAAVFATPPCDTLLPTGPAESKRYVDFLDMIDAAYSRARYYVDALALYYDQQEGRQVEWTQLMPKIAEPMYSLPSAAHANALIGILSPKTPSCDGAYGPLPNALVLIDVHYDNADLDKVAQETVESMAAPAKQLKFRPHTVEGQVPVRAHTVKGRGVVDGKYSLIDAYAGEEQYAKLLRMRRSADPDGVFGAMVPAPLLHGNKQCCPVS